MKSDVSPYSQVPAILNNCDSFSQPMSTCFCTGVASTQTQQQQTTCQISLIQTFTGHIAILFYQCHLILSQLLNFNIFCLTQIMSINFGSSTRPPQQSTHQTLHPPVGQTHMKKIDAGYYFRNIEPLQVQNVVKNFYQELAEGRKRFKDILMKKYSNVLQCEDNFNQMTSACASLSKNVESMHESLVRINTDYLTQISDQLNLMQVSPQNEDGSPYLAMQRAEKSEIEVYQIVEKITELNTIENGDAKEEQRFLEQKLIHENLRLALTQKFLVQNPSLAIQTCLSTMLYAKQVSSQSGKHRQVILKGIQMVTSRQCKFKITSEMVLDEPVKAAYQVLFQLVILGINTDPGMSIDMQQLLQASKVLCNPLEKEALGTIDRIFGVKIEENDLKPVFNEHKGTVCEMVKLKLVQLQENMKPEEVLEVASTVEDPMTSCLLTLDQASWQSLIDHFESFGQSNSQELFKAASHAIKKDPIVKDVREDVYAVFVITQDESRAMTKSYASFVKQINDLVKSQLQTRELINKHLEEKASKHTELDWVSANQEIQQAYSQHRQQALAKISDQVVTRIESVPYEAFIMGLGLYVVAYLANTIENDTDSKIVKLVQDAFKKAIQIKIKQTYPAEVKQLKYQLKFRKITFIMLSSIASKKQESDDELHEETLQLDMLFKSQFGL